MVEKSRINWQVTLISLLRMTVGWHFLYEGLIKLVGEWSAGGYLNNTYGALSIFYHWLAASPVRLEIVDILNIAGLIGIGLALFLGVFIKWSSLLAIFLLTLYYFAYPPFGISLMSANDTGVYIVDKIFLEAVVLVFLFFNKEKGYGLENLMPLLHIKRNKLFGNKEEIHPETIQTSDVKARRDMIKNLVSLPFLGVMGYGIHKNKRKYGIDTLSGATIQVNRMELNELKGELPKGRIGNHEMSRLMMGGNLIGG